MNRNKLFYAECWRCRKKHKRLPGIKIRFPFITEIKGYAVAELPLPLCGSCIKSFKEWCNRQTNEFN